MMDNLFLYYIICILSLLFYYSYYYFLLLLLLLLLMLLSSSSSTLSLSPSYSLSLDVQRAQSEAFAARSMVMLRCSGRPQPADWSACRVYYVCATEHVCVPVSRLHTRGRSLGVDAVGGPGRASCVQRAGRWRWRDWELSRTPSAPCCCYCCC